MPKLLRSELKSIVKECLVEILAEGIGNSNVATNEYVNESNQESFKSAPKKHTLSSKRRKSYLDSMQMGSSKTNQNSKKTNLTNDPVLNELLADTAQTTLKEQVAADSKNRMAGMSRPADAAAAEVSKSLPEDLFGGEAAGKWAKLAFFDQ